ncbi:hypothetical protein Mterra_01290 [Calidithermus terrae]|uniref:Uncharacterized protein n=1 Tax=Calidithermus terrae TaxID=1408545 RepID=A0A399ETC2_9DEIN|nr:hypothetical protein [Calidithermus terrae]RIH86975.1 hypothetical protein Mterra_01290 [Calidithermus terrae]
MKIYAYLSLLLLLAACARPPAPPQVVVRPETRVLDPAARQALEEVQPDGTLVFAGSAAAAFQAGNVLVSEPGAKAPEGLLRRVTGLEQSGGKTLVRTAQAQIGDALQKGRLSVEQELTEADLGSVSVLTPGVRLLGRPSPQAEGEFRVGIDVKLGEGNLEPLTVSGELRFKPVIKVDLDLDCGFLCVYDNDLDFLAQVGLKQTTALKIAGKAGFNLKKTIPLAVFNFTPKTFFIGPVPVVITPRIVLELRTDGSVTTVISYEVGGTLTAVAGAKYDDGWKNISELNYGFHAGPVNVPFPLAGVVEVKALAALRGELKLYGVVGPTLEIAPFVHIDLKYPRDPIWKLNGGIQGNVGVRVDVLGYSKHYQTNLWDDSVEIARSDNSAPQVKFLSGSTGDIGLCCTLRVEVNDPEEGANCCTVSFKSSNPADGAEGQLGSATGVQPELAYAFTTLGKRTITATATDGKGKPGSATLELEVVNTPPTVAISAPFNGQEFFRGVNYTLRGVSYDPNEAGFQLPCSGLSWTSSAAGDPSPRIGCDVTLSFPANGPRTLTLTGTDSHGGSGSASVNINVIDPPANLPPVVNITKPLNGTRIGPDTVIQLAGNATDPEGGAVTLAWDVTTGYNPQTGQGAATYPVTPAADGGWKPTDSIPYGSCEVSDTLRLRLKARDPQNNEGSDFVVIKVLRVC